MLPVIGMVVLLVVSGIYALYLRAFGVKFRKRFLFFLSVITLVISAFVTFLLLALFSYDGVLYRFVPIDFIYVLLAMPIVTTIIMTGIIALFTHLSIIKSYGLGFLSTVFSFGMLAMLMWGWLWAGDFCGKRLILFHDFNNHLKDVCMRDGARECPQNESELQAFNPKKYADLQKCYKTKYWFDPKTGEYAWVIREVGKHFVFVANPQLNEGFSQFFNSFTAQGTNASASALPAGDIPWSSLYP